MGRITEPGGCIILAASDLDSKDEVRVCLLGAADDGMPGGRGGGGYVAMGRGCGGTGRYMGLAPVLIGCCGIGRGGDGLYIGLGV